MNPNKTKSEWSENLMLEERNWFGRERATKDDLAKLCTSAPADLPQSYLELLSFSNGGEGPLSINPYYLCLDPANEVIQRILGENYGQADLHGFLIFGGNGGGEYLAFDTRGRTPWPVVTIDMVAGGESAATVAPNFEEFCRFIGREA